MARLLAGHFFCICLKRQNLQTMKYTNIYGVRNSETDQVLPKMYTEKERAEAMSTALNEKRTYPCFVVECFTLTTLTKFVIVDSDNE